MAFFNFVVIPFYSAVAKALPVSEAVGLAGCQANLKAWQGMKSASRASSREISQQSDAWSSRETSEKTESGSFKKGNNWAAGAGTPRQSRVAGPENA